MIAAFSILTYFLFKKFMTASVFIVTKGIIIQGTIYFLGAQKVEFHSAQINRVHNKIEKKGDEIKFSILQVE